jgi:hypothetical protein
MRKQYVLLIALNMQDQRCSSFCSCSRKNKCIKWLLNVTVPAVQSSDDEMLQFFGHSTVKIFPQEKLQNKEKKYCKKGVHCQVSTHINIHTV